MVVGRPTADAWPMTATFEHPSLRLPVTPEQRDRAENWLQEAYADGRISEYEFDRRIGQVISAGTRRELNEAFFGLVQVTAPSQALGVHPAYQPLVRPETRPSGRPGSRRGRALLALLLVAARPGAGLRADPAGQLPPARGREGLQLPADFRGRIHRDVHPGRRHRAGRLRILVPVMFVGWFILTIVGGAKALQGEDWKNPVKHVIKLEALSERERR